MARHLLSDKTIAQGIKSAAASGKPNTLNDGAGLQIICRPERVDWWRHRYWLEREQHAGGPVSRFAFCASLFQATTIVSPLRIEYAGAVYHVTSRGDRREPIAKEDVDRSQRRPPAKSCATKTSPMPFIHTAPAKPPSHWPSAYPPRQLAASWRGWRGGIHRDGLQNGKWGT